MYNTKAYSAASATPRRWPPPRSSAAIQLNATCKSKSSSCGICHSDLHQVRNEWSRASCQLSTPASPGHEIVGRVTKVGTAVTKYKLGDLAAVGCMVDSDGNLPELPGRSRAVSART